MQTSIAIESYKLMHWMNARKLTAPMTAERSGIDAETIEQLADGRRTEISVDSAERLAQVLNIGLPELQRNASPTPDVIYLSRTEVEATKRPVNRGGIHFYNYYTLPSPSGHIAPVLIDILCPSDRLPTQNNGHLEPAITINLGPGHINGLWGHQVDDDTWHPFYANQSGDHSWIIGDSYVEPPYCPHTYSRHGDEPTQILSYTVRSNLSTFLAGSNDWSDRVYENFLGMIDDRSFGALALKTLMARHCYDGATLAERSGIGGNRLSAFLEGDQDALEISDLRSLGQLLGFDYRLLMPVATNHDAVGKSWCSVENSIRSIRPYQSYSVASMAVSPQCPDLMGLFMRVGDQNTMDEPDLMDHSSSHYLVTEGSMMFRWQAADGSIVERWLETRDTLWVGPFVRHGFSGRGALIKMGNGEGSTYLDYFEMSNTYDASTALVRGRRDRESWTPVSG